MSDKSSKHFTIQANDVGTECYEDAYVHELEAGHKEMLDMLARMLETTKSMEGWAHACDIESEDDLGVMNSECTALISRLKGGAQ